LVEVTQILKEGFYLKINSEEFFLSFDQYSWFKKATVQQIFDVKMLYEEELRWDDLDIDLHIDSIRHPENYPRKISDEQCYAFLIEKTDTGYEAYCPNIPNWQCNASSIDELKQKIEEVYDVDHKLHDKLEVKSENTVVGLFYRYWFL